MSQVHVDFDRHVLEVQIKLLILHNDSIVALLLAPHEVLDYGVLQIVLLIEFVLLQWH